MSQTDEEALDEDDEGWGKFLMKKTDPRLGQKSSWKETVFWNVNLGGYISSRQLAQLW